ncbi:MAG: adaptor protein MecA [Eubacteriales bacterium]|nr:adaptor protein MecA [Eubacteriales bacterium]
MKIEKVNENQIRCTLTGEDLAKRQLKISELAYGTEKAKNLFRDMMQQASFQFGFDAENIPLMIEAIPLNADCIVLIVTKVEDPEELDTRFSSFAPSVRNASGRSDGNDAASAFERLIGAIKKTQEALSGEAGAKSADEIPSEEEAFANARRFIFTNRLFAFTSLNDVITVSGLIHETFQGRSSLYQDEQAGKYYLFLSMPDTDAVSAMQHVLAVLTEYGTQEVNSYAREQHLKEHCTVLCPDNALEELAKV